MYIDHYLSKNGTVKTPVTGTNIYLAKGGLVQVTCRPSNHVYVLRERDQIGLPDNERYESLEIINLGPEGEISLNCIEGRFYPSMDGSKLGISADFTADSLAVSFEGRQPVSLLPTTKVKAELTNLPETLQVNVTNPQEIPEVQKVHIVEESAPSLVWVAHETMTHTGKITGNVKRKELLLQADAGNTKTIWLGGFEGKGFPILAGGGFILSNGAEIDILIPTDCKLYVSEVTA